MDAILRSLVIYLILMVIFRIAGKRSLAEVTTFDFVLLLVIGESTQQALLGNDFSMTNAFLVIVSLIGIDIALSLIKQRFPFLGKVLDSVPIVILKDGEPIRDRMNKARISEGDIMAQARKQQGLERLDQIKYAVLEQNGGITIVPKKSGG